MTIASDSQVIAVGERSYHLGNQTITLLPVAKDIEEPAYCNRQAECVMRCI